ncbi:MAG: hypothetical protein BA863_02745 [Desulfovibrio sp. S3730MH75]|nr:MAG: hypothetical protein BA863_02745 [Desulfovibrio sp. S3730MH75]
MTNSNRSRAAMRLTADNCIDCGLCVSHCTFLQGIGSPDKVAENGLSSESEHDETAIKSYHCSTCSLCSSVCPVDANPANMFIELRNHAQDKQLIGLDAYSPLLKYEKVGTCFPFKDNILPEGCETVFFPGCTLPAMFPKGTNAAYSALKQQDPSIGMILNCCSKPSKMLGLKTEHTDAISDLFDFMKSKGIKRILTACPNCHITFKEFSSEIEIISIYEVLANLEIKTNTAWLKQATVHDPCVTRFEPAIHDSVRTLLIKTGVELVEMEHTREQTFCCGEGGGVPMHNDENARAWTRKRLTEAKQTGAPIVTYCAGCANYLSGKKPVAHVLDLLFVKRDETPELPKFPLGYLNRLKLKILARFA